MLPGELKPILTALVMPPTAPLLLALLGLLLAARKRVRAGLTIAFIGIAGLWLLSCHAVAIALAHTVLPQVPAAQPAQLAQARVQAIVVLGGGIVPQAPEYGAAQPTGYTLARLRYGAWLARRTGQPLAFAGGIGWAAGDGFPPEAEAARRTLAEFGAELRWADAQSRDTAENAARMHELLAREQISRIALVTDAWHMPRSVLEFERAGFTVLPAPTGFAAAPTRPLLAWLPSADGLALSRQVLREALGLWVARP
ncbi:YdcF family protein [Ramlibacter tataouinensis]|uniref:YdcF family protein n=1 Tax=Ramlibacter tataouinensis TaxID=94132 RepID=UPI0022F3CA70|nr:YdcF family protein [Ramlibacter tataouinensis]WBY01314.1 YdcF family protein [Ramlibacter tataouinensis]